MSDSRTDRAEAAIRRSMRQGMEVKEQLLHQGVGPIARLALLLVDTFRAGHKVLLFGNGGSAADAQHVAGELVGRFLIDRQALPAIALTTDTSILTATANDFGFEHIFVRQVQALAQEGDMAVGISTSGNSPDVLQGIQAAKDLGVKTVALTGAGGGKLKGLADLCVCVPSECTPAVQEVHIAIWHAVCDVVERELFRS
jgi:D-sedoheptulose 7-phosphate isomerase